MPASPYWAWLSAQAHAAHSDGCTLVSEMFHECCEEHDLAYRYGKDPWSAYIFGWEDAESITRAEADARFRQCIQERSHLGKASPISWIRWAGVRLGGWKAWGKRHDAPPTKG